MDNFDTYERSFFALGDTVMVKLPDDRDVLRYSFCRIEEITCVTRTDPSLSTVEKLILIHPLWFHCVDGTDLFVKSLSLLPRHPIRNSIPVKVGDRKENMLFHVFNADFVVQQVRFLSISVFGVLS